jgi:hypothetical protein
VISAACFSRKELSARSACAHQHRTVEAIVRSVSDLAATVFRNHAQEGRKEEVGEGERRGLPVSLWCSMALRITRNLRIQAMSFKT